MVMVDRLVEVSEVVTVTAFVIRPDNILVEDGLFREPGLIENMAQSAAAGTGARSVGPGEEAPVGFIGGIRHLEISAFPKVGEEITTRVTVLHNVMEAAVVQAEVFLAGRCIASCEMKIFLKVTTS